MTWHPTTNRIPTERLKPKQLAALKAWPHGFECYYTYSKWRDCRRPMWLEGCIYRGKLAPTAHLEKLK